MLNNHIPAHAKVHGRADVSVFLVGMSTPLTPSVLRQSTRQGFPNVTTIKFLIQRFCRCSGPARPLPGQSHDHSRARDKGGARLRLGGNPFTVCANHYGLADFRQNIAGAQNIRANYSYGKRPSTAASCAFPDAPAPLAESGVKRP